MSIALFVVGLVGLVTIQAETDIITAGPVVFEVPGNGRRCGEKCRQKGGRFRHAWCSERAPDGACTAVKCSCDAVPSPDAPEVKLVPASAETADRFNSLFAQVPAKILVSSPEELFHEAGVWMPKTQEWLVTSNRLNATLPNQEPNLVTQNVQILAISPSGGHRRLPKLEEKIILANGGTTDFSGGAYLVSQGLGATPGSVWKVNPTLDGATEIKVPGLDGELNSPNDIVVTRLPYSQPGGGIFFTDPAFGVQFQGFRTTFRNDTGVLLLQQGRNVTQDTRFNGPNGILLSPNEDTLYVGDIFSRDPSIFRPRPDLDIDRMAPRPGPIICDVHKYDVTKSENGLLSISNRRLFFDMAVNGTCPLGVPDGMKADTAGNVYTSIGAGVSVHSPSGEYLGMVLIPDGSANLAFGGSDGHTLMVLNEKKAFALQMNVAGALGPYSTGP